jgi:hypothetical protein
VQTSKKINYKTTWWSMEMEHEKIQQSKWHWQKLRTFIRDNASLPIESKTIRNWSMIVKVPQSKKNLKIKNKKWKKITTFLYIGKRFKCRPFQPQNNSFNSQRSTFRKNKILFQKKGGKTINPKSRALAKRA